MKDCFPTRDNRRERHQKWHDLNHAILKEDGVVWTREANGGSTILFRELNMPRADFYPHTGRWKDCATGNVHRGGAKLFLVWYRKEAMKYYTQPA